MAIYRSLKALTRNPNASRNFLTATTASISSPPYAPLIHPLYHPFFPLPSQSSRLLSPFTNWIIPFQGPLFLSYPPWKLSQSATPLYLHGNGVVLRKIEALNLNLLQRRAKFPLKLKLESVSSGQGVLDRVDSKESGDGLFDSFVNLPNLISMSRLISGPVLGWYDSCSVPIQICYFLYRFSLLSIW